jgi:hypothetical protein
VGASSSIGRNPGEGWDVGWVGGCQILSPQQPASIIDPPNGFMTLHLILGQNPYVLQRKAVHLIFLNTASVLSHMQLSWTAIYGWNWVLQKSVLGQSSEGMIRVVLA